MIVADTSALMAVILREARVDDCIAALAVQNVILMSAGTLVETYIVALRRGVQIETAQMLKTLPIDVVTVTPDFARLCADAYARWGKGIHKASLNFGDCFAYALAKERDCALLFIGEDFSQTDIRRVL